MSDLLEIVMTSESSGSMWTTCAWDIRNGTHLMTYKGGGSANARSLSFIRNEFIATANSTKPLIHIWPVNSQEQVQALRFVTPAKVSSLAISPDGLYCVAGLSENIYIWHITSGRLLVMISRHYQTVSTIKFIDDGTHFISAGQDGMVFVWNLSRIIACDSRSNGQPPTPLYSFSDHALAVTDVFIGNGGGLRSLLITTSIDRSCKIYDLASGTLMLNLVFEDALTAVTMDYMETKVYAGSAKGIIYEFSIQSPPRMREFHLSKTDLNNQFSGHKGVVTCLSCSIDGESLLSGGNDGNVHLWHISSRQLIRTLAHKGMITNAMFILTPKAMFDQEHKLQLIACNFKKMIEQETNDNFVVEVMVTTTTTTNQNNQQDTNDGDGDDDNNDYAYYKSKQISLPTTTSQIHSPNPTELSGKSAKKSSGNSDELASLRAEINILKKVNKELYEFSVTHILKKK